jgi:hypothetical protein
MSVERGDRELQPYAAPPVECNRNPWHGCGEEKQAFDKAEQQDNPLLDDDLSE